MIFVCYIFLVKKKKYGSSSACCSKFSKFIDLPSSSGVPVFNLPILKLYLSSCSLNPVEGFSSNLPAGVFFQYGSNHLKSPGGKNIWKI